MFTALLTDAYKLFHKDAYIDGLTKVYGNKTNRSGRLSNIPESDGVMNFGNQYYIQKYLIEGWNTTFFKQDKNIACGFLKMHVDAILDEDVDISHFEELHDLGYLPVEIKSLPEGVMVPYGVADTTYQTTHDDFGWVGNYLETLHSQCVWPMQTSATTSRAYLKNTLKAYESAGVDPGAAWFMNHDFSARGMFGPEAAMISSMGQLTSSCGTDTIAGIMGVAQYYGADVKTECVGKSVYATEHSTATSYIMALAQSEGITKFEAEIKYVKYLFTKVKEHKILAHVSDSFDFWKFVTEGLELLKQDILARSGKFVVRPDSGDPVEVLCGIEFKTVTVFDDDFEGWKATVAEELYEEYRTKLKEDPTNPFSNVGGFYRAPDGTAYDVSYEPELARISCFSNSSPSVTNFQKYYYVDNMNDVVEYCTFTEMTLDAEQKGLIESLWEVFGGTTNEAGFKVLHDQIGAIYGDSITLERQTEIYRRMMDKGFAPLVVLGVGSYSYQYVTRDTHGSAVKATYIEENGNSVNVCKSPKTDATKKSAYGLLRIELENGVYVQYDGQTLEQEAQGELRTIFKDSKLVLTTTLKEVRDNVVASI